MFDNSNDEKLYTCQESKNAHYVIRSSKLRMPWKLRYTLLQYNKTTKTPSLKDSDTALSTHATSMSRFLTTQRVNGTQQ